MSTTRSDITEDVTYIRTVAKPYGQHRKGYPPSLGDLRAFVAACEGLPDDTTVRIDRQSMGSGSDYADVILEATIRQRRQSDEAEGAAS